jgi:hypothetical protein
MDKLEVVPLITIQDEVFKHQYELGVMYALSQERQERMPILDSYLVVNLKYAAACGYFAPLQRQKLSRLGFCLGSYHGVMLSVQAPDLGIFSHEESERGYHCGRRAYFGELSCQERTYTDERVLSFFAQIMQENVECLDGGDDSLLYWCVGDLFGVLSGQLFPSSHVQGNPKHGKIEKKKGEATIP